MASFDIKSEIDIHELTNAVDQANRILKARFDFKGTGAEFTLGDKQILLSAKEDFQINTKYGSYRLRAYQQTTNDQVHIALTKGHWKDGESVLVKVNSTLINNDILGTLTNNADKKIDDMFSVFNKEGKGAIVFINQQSHTVNLLSRLKALKEAQKDNEIAKAPRIVMDSKDFGIGAQILHDIGIHKIRLVSNSKNTKKRVGMIGYGLEIIDYVNY